MELATSSSRVPVCGQEKIPGLDLSILFREFFLKTKNSFLFESVKGPKETARYSLMGGGYDKTLEIKSTPRNKIIGVVQKGGFSSTLSPLDHLMEETKIRLKNKQNLPLILIIYINTLVKIFIKKIFT